tara:strand:- start:48 stop:197 length:150 start_codon:yes stop_codon:yes gene_type:complete
MTKKTKDNKSIMVIVRVSKSKYKGYNLNAFNDLLKKNPLTKFEVINITS